MHKIHRPDLIDGVRHCQRLWLLTVKSLTGFDPKIELKRFVNPVNTLVVPFKAFDVSQVEVTESKTPVAVVVCQPK